MRTPHPENLNLEIPQDPELSEQQCGIARGNLDLTSCNKAQLELQAHTPTRGCVWGGARIGASVDVHMSIVGLT